MTGKNSKFSELQSDSASSELPWSMFDENASWSSDFDVSVDFAEFPWDSFIGRMPEVDDIIDHELNNEIQSAGMVYEEGEPVQWTESKNYSFEDDVLGAFERIEEGKESTEFIDSILEDKDVPNSAKSRLRYGKNVLAAKEDYNRFLLGKNNSEYSIGYDFFIEPFCGREKVEVTDRAEELRKSGYEIEVGESAFFFMTTVHKNFKNHVVGAVEDPKLQIDSYIEGDYAVLELSDNGEGLDDSEEPFRPQGAGDTGLYPVKQIVEEYDGEIELFDPDLGGCGIRAYLPLESSTQHQNHYREDSSEVVPQPSI